MHQYKDQTRYTNGCGWTWDNHQISCSTAVIRPLTWWWFCISPDGVCHHTFLCKVQCRDDLSPGLLVSFEPLLHHTMEVMSIKAMLLLYCVQLVLMIRNIAPKEKHPPKPLPVPHTMQCPNNSVHCEGWSWSGEQVVMIIVTWSSKQASEYQNTHVKNPGC